MNINLLRCLFYSFIEVFYCTYYFLTDTLVEENEEVATIQIPEETEEQSMNLTNMDTDLLQSVTEKDQVWHM